MKTIQEKLSDIKSKLLQQNALLQQAKENLAKSNEAVRLARIEVDREIPKQKMNIPFPHIKMSDIRPEVKEIAMSWVEAYRPDMFIADKVKLASDIQNYADWYAAQKVGEQRLVTTGYEKTTEIFKWLLGYYDFPEPPKEGRPLYYWRTHLLAKLKEIGIEIEPPTLEGFPLKTTLI